MHKVSAYYIEGKKACSMGDLRFPGWVSSRSWVQSNLNIVLTCSSWKSLGGILHESDISKKISRVLSEDEEESGSGHFYFTEPHFFPF